MASVVFKHSSAGYIELMKSGAMRECLRGYAEGIEGAAQAALSPDKGTPLYSAPYRSVDFTTRERAGVRVQTSNDHAMNAELSANGNAPLKSAAGV